MSVHCFLQHLKPKNVNFTPRHKNKGKTNIARKKIINSAMRKVKIFKYLQMTTLWGIDKNKKCLIYSDTGSLFRELYNLLSKFGLVPNIFYYHRQCLTIS